MEVDFVAELWRWKGDSPWHFLTVPTEESEEVSALAGRRGRGFGSVPVQVRIGETAWQTSLFPSDGQYLLPVKKAVRLAEDLDVGEPAHVHLTVDLDRAR